MIAALVVLLALWLAAPVPGQPADKPAAAEPGEPDIVLPEVILRIEDFSVENVEGALPTGEEALPPARELPLPAREELAVSEPVAPLQLGSPAGPAPGAAERALSAQAEFGAGSMNHVFGQVALFGVGQEPRFRLRFLHETLDGMGGERPGLGFNFREDSLEGGLKFGLGAASLEAAGTLREEERGLQGQGLALEPFGSRLLRQGSLAADLTWPFAEHWSLTGSLAGSFATQLLTGPSPEAFTELLVSPMLSLELRYPRFQLALESRYALRQDPVQRAAALLRLGLDLAEAWRLEASGGWRWDSLTGHLLPFHASLTGAPWPSFSFQAGGGFRVEELNAGDLLTAFPFSALPAAAIRDNPGWYADLAATFSLRQAFSLQTALRLAWPEARPEAQPAPDPPDPLGQGLLPPVRQQAAQQAEVEAALAWTPGRQTSLRAAWSMQLLDRPAFVPANELRVDGEAATRSGRWGARSEFVFRWGYDPAPPAFTLMPELSLSGYFQASEAIRVTAEFEDLLQPFNDGPRLIWDPFVAPGVRGTMKIQINL